MIAIKYVGLSKGWHVLTLFSFGKIMDNIKKIELKFYYTKRKALAVGEPWWSAPMG